MTQRNLLLKSLQNTASRSEVAGLGAPIINIIRGKALHSAFQIGLDHYSNRSLGLVSITIDDMTISGSIEPSNL